MNRNQRKYGRAPARPTFAENQTKSKENVVVEVFAKGSSQPKPSKHMANRCCSIRPDLQDFGQQQSVEKQQDQTKPPGKQPATQQEQYQKLILEQYGFDPVLPDTINQLKELRKVLCGNNSSKVENSSQYVCPEEKTVRSENSGWQNVDNADEIDNYMKKYDTEKLESDSSLPQNVHICEVPRVKIIAEKYSKLKKNNVEVRQLDEKVVCIEYDIYKGNNTAKPKQTLRAFFAVKPIKVTNESSKECIQQLTEKFDIKDEDLNKLNRKEIEMIDSKIQENKPYLEDLRRILKRSQAIYTKKNKTSLDLLSLYEMAKKESPPLDENYSHTNLLSKAELEEVKQLILKKCTSSVNGISRRKLRSDNVPDKDRKHNTLSDSLVSVLMQV